MVRRGFAKRASKGGKGAGSSKKFNAAGRHVLLHGSPVWIPSEAQAIRLEQLIQMEEDGVITELRAEVPVDLIVNRIRICRYRCDHVYFSVDAQGRRDQLIYEDVKGLLTPDFKLKHKLFDALMAPDRLRLIASPNWNDRSASQKEKGLKVKDFSIRDWFDEHWKNKIPV